MPLGLRLRWLWLKTSWPFRWAHKPLCDRFSEDVLEVGKLHVCRSCVCLYAGLALAALALAFGWAPGVVGTGVALLVTAGLSAPRVYKGWPRRLRDALRFSAGALIVWTGALAWTAPWIGVPAVALLAGAWWVYFRQRAARKAAACAGCPELGAGVCSGFAEQAALARRFEDRASELVARARGLPIFTPEPEARSLCSSTP